MPAFRGTPGSAVLRGVLFMVGATALFIVMNTTVKLLSAHLPVAEIIWARTLGHLVLIVALFAPTHGGWRLLVTRAPAAQFSRSVLLIASTSLFFTAIGRVPLADATAVSFTAPLVVAALAGPVLGERVTVGHWIAIAAGFLGALLVIAPSGAGFNPWATLVVGSAACYAGYQLLTRHVAAVDAPETSVTYSALVGTLLMSAIVPFVWKTPESLSHALPLAALGLFGGLGHYCVARAFALGAASIMSPFHYVQLVWAAALGYLVFGDVPGVATWFGAALIIGSGLFVALSERRRSSSTGGRRT
ncbi:MAG: DMT family transporter [Candidatus Rokubacteria bacterium]|nr:DMT family transporter [Candidatus Rokubacteria bacterium]